MYDTFDYSVKYHIFRDFGISGIKISGSKKYFDPILALELYEPKLQDSVYNFFVLPEMLLKFAYVFRKETKTKAYQRLLKSSRISSIAKFINKEQGHFLNNIIIDFSEEENKIKFDPIKINKNEKKNIKLGYLYIPRVYCFAWIIDGQHRLYGYTETEEGRKNDYLPVTATKNLEKSKQAELFLNINIKQKRVNSNLAWTIYSNLKDEPKGEIANIAINLNKRAPFKNKIWIPGESTFTEKYSNQSDFPVYITNICSGLSVLGFTTRYKDFDIDKILRSYFSVISELFKVNWNKERRGFYFTNGGVKVMLILLSYILQYQMKFRDSKDPTKTDFKNLLNLLKGFINSKNTDKIRKDCANEANRKEVAKKMFRKIKRDVKKQRKLKKQYSDISLIKI